MTTTLVKTAVADQQSPVMNHPQQEVHVRLLQSSKLQQLTQLPAPKIPVDRPKTVRESSQSTMLKKCCCSGMCTKHQRLINLIYRFNCDVASMAVIYAK
jgi:hypothetical protein